MSFDLLHNGSLDAGVDPNGDLEAWEMSQTLLHWPCLSMKFHFFSGGSDAVMEMDEETNAEDFLLDIVCTKWTVAVSCTIQRSRSRGGGSVLGQERQTKGVARSFAERGNRQCRLLEKAWDDKGRSEGKDEGVGRNLEAESFEAKERSG